MGTIKKQNSTTFLRCPKNEQYPFCRIPAKLFDLDGYQLAIMGYILSNKDEWNIVKYEIANRANFPRNKFDEAWKSLEDLGYIKKTRIQSGWDYVIIEDLSFTTTTGGICEDSTSTTGTTCAGGMLTTTKNNYNNTDESFIHSIDEPMKTATTTKPDYVSLDLHNQYLELKKLYPTDVIRSDGSTDYLKTNNKRCETLYASYLKEGLFTHTEVMNCLKVELDNRNHTGKMKYIKKFINWLSTREFEGYKDWTLESVTSGYGKELI